MATILNKLPREMRDQIYRELLLDDVHDIGIVHHCHHHLNERKQLSPAILQVCKQVFFEASIILYEENIFCFTDSYCYYHHHHVYEDLRLNKGIRCSDFAHEMPFLPPEKKIGTFERIKHVSRIPIGVFIRLMSNVSTIQLKLSYYGSKPPAPGGPFIMNYTIRVMNRIAETGCSLKTLRLSWKFRNFKYSCNELDAASLGITNDIADLKVQQKIEITVHSDYAGCYRACEAIANEIGSLMQWATNTTKKCTKFRLDEDGEVRKEDHTHEEEEENLVGGSQKNSKAETSSDSDIAQNPPCNYDWTWTLGPTATMVKDEGSETAKSLN